MVSLESTGVRAIRGAVVLALTIASVSCGSVAAGVPVAGRYTSVELTTAAPDSDAIVHIEFLRPRGGQATLAVTSEPGCNGFAGQFIVEDDGLVIQGDLAAARLGCPSGDGEAVERWLADYLLGSPAIVQETSESLVLSSDEGDIALESS